MTDAIFSILSEAMGGCQDGRQVRLRLDGLWFEITDLTNDVGDEAAAYAVLSTGERLTFDPARLVGVQIGAKVRSR